jgi:hypothetical protein
MLNSESSNIESVLHLGLKLRSIKCDKIVDQTILSHLIDLNFKPKYDKCDGPEMNTSVLHFA